MKWLVHKFGGTRVADAAKYKNLAKLVAHEKNFKTAIVVSAMSKVTDALIELGELAKVQNPKYLEKIDALKQRHLQTVAELLPVDQQSPLKKVFDEDFEVLKQVLNGVWHLKSINDRTTELISGHGELWSAQMLNAYLKSLNLKSQWLDARKVLIVEPGETAVNVLWPETQERIDRWLKETPTELLVITGFVASTPDEISTTLRRNGSDYSASIFGSLLNAESINIWTDVDGVLSADPRLVPKLSY